MGKDSIFYFFRLSVSCSYNPVNCYPDFANKNFVIDCDYID